MLNKIFFPETSEKAREVYFVDGNKISGFFFENRWLSNLWPAKVFLDGVEFSCVENAYQAYKYEKDLWKYFQNENPKDTVKLVDSKKYSQRFSGEEWLELKMGVMEKLLEQKFDEKLNPELNKKLKVTEEKYLEEGNYWGDNYWGVHKNSKDDKGVGENNLGKLLMKIRSQLF